MAKPTTASREVFAYRVTEYIEREDETLKEIQAQEENIPTYEEARERAMAESKRLAANAKMGETYVWTVYKLEPGGWETYDPPFVVP